MIVHPKDMPILTEIPVTFVGIEPSSKATDISHGVSAAS